MIRLVCLSVLITFICACSPVSQSPTTETKPSKRTHLPLEVLSGGDATSFVFTNDAFSQHPNAIAKNFALDAAFTTGDHLFRSAQNGVGPLFNNPSCQGCHLNDGRGVVPTNKQTLMTSMLVKLGDSRGQPDPNYGGQLQPFMLNPVAIVDPKSHISISTNGAWREGEGLSTVRYETISGKYASGETYELRQPIYEVSALKYGPFMEDIQFSARVAPQVFGVGLLDAIPNKDIRALADPNDTNNDGISGRVSMAFDITTKSASIGKFAYKAQSVSTLQQVAAAFNGDSGVTSVFLPKSNCTPIQTDCALKADNTGKADASNKALPDISEETLAFIEFYNRTLAVPARRGYSPSSGKWDHSVAQGKKLFKQLSCLGCHVAKHTTGIAKGSVLGAIGLTGLIPNPPPIDVLSKQVIFPYTDMLLHDMGGKCEVTVQNEVYTQRCTGLADGLPQGSASGSEWRTAPLWGIGLVQTVNPQATFLHDGRARTIEEAILWHGGEAARSLADFKMLSKNERTQLLAFLESM